MSRVYKIFRSVRKSHRIAIWLGIFYGWYRISGFIDEKQSENMLKDRKFDEFVEERNSRGPYLIIAPLSTVDNWNSEVLKFVTSLKPLVYIGNKTEREGIRERVVTHILKLPIQQRKDPPLFFDVLITTYDLILHDLEFLSKFIWRYVIIDEAHRLKNSKSVLVQVCILLTLPPHHEKKRIIYN